jgi:hypothetical protein
MMMDKKLVRDLCNDALATCGSINANLITLQSRLELELPVNETARIIDADMQALDTCMKAIRKAVVGGDENGCEEPC